MGVKAGFLPLDVQALCRSYRSARSRLIVLDWGGTLVAENDKVREHTRSLSQVLHESVVFINGRAILIVIYCCYHMLYLHMLYLHHSMYWVATFVLSFLFALCDISISTSFFSPLQSDKLQAYALAKGHATRTGPTEALKETLEALCADEKNVRLIFATSSYIFGTPVLSPPVCNPVLPSLFL